MSPVGIDGKIEAEGDIYLLDSFWKKLEEIGKDNLSGLLEEQEGLGWYHIEEYKLDEARTNEIIAGLPEDGDCILVLSLDGSAEIKLNSANADAFDLEVYKKIRHPFEDLYLTNTAQSGKILKLLIGKGGWDIVEKIPEIDLSGTIRNDYLSQITDPLKIAQIIEDGHIVEHADIACEKILISGTERLDQWRSTEDYTYIAPGKILLKSTTKLSDWQHPSDMTYIHGGQVYTESIQTVSLAALCITTAKLAALSVTTAKLDALAVTTVKLDAGAVTAAKMTITDLADIANLLTVATGKILIGEDVLGTDLHGIKIVDDQATPVTRLEIGHVAAGVANYGINIYDSAGVKTVNLGAITHEGITNQVAWLVDPVTVVSFDNNTSGCAPHPTTGWVDLDLTASSSANAVGFFLQVAVKWDGVGSTYGYARVRYNGRTTDEGSLTAKDLNQSWASSDGLVKCDTGQVVEYQWGAADGAGQVDVRIYLVGWILDSQTT